MAKHQFQVGERVRLLPFTKKEFRFGRVESQVQIVPEGPEFWYTVRRDDGKLLDMDESELRKPHGEGKYHDPADFAERLHPGEPWFVLLAHDRLSVPAVLAYVALLEGAGLHDAAKDVRAFTHKFKDWQEANPLHVKMPD